MLERALIKRIGRRQRRMILPGVTDKGEIDAGQATLFRRGEIGVVGQQFVDLDRQRIGRRIGHHLAEQRDHGPVAGTGFEHHRPAAATTRFKVDDRADATGERIAAQRRCTLRRILRNLTKEIAGAIQPCLLGIGK